VLIQVICDGISAEEQGITLPARGIDGDSLDAAREALVAVCAEVNRCLKLGPLSIVVDCSDFQSTPSERLVVAGLGSAVRHYSAEIGHRGIRINAFVRKQRSISPSLATVSMMTGQMVGI
jgi:hypothetical protein